MSITTATTTDLWRMSATDLCLDAAAALEDRVGIVTPIDPGWW
jgi:hypothetical protein